MSANTILKVPAESLLRAPIKGPNGCKIIGYSWRSELGEKWSNREGALVPGRVSDWDRSETSAGTGREIVHVFYVEHGDGRISIEGAGSACNILGITERKLRSRAEIERVNRLRDLQAEREEVARYAKVAADSPFQATRDFFLRNIHAFRTMADEEKALAETVIFEMGGKFIRRYPQSRAAMERHGWQVVNNDGSRIVESTTELACGVQQQ